MKILVRAFLMTVFCGISMWPIAGAAQRLDPNSAVDAQMHQFNAFEGHAFGFERANFHRFVSGPNGFEPWHRRRSHQDTTQIYRLLEIDRIRTAIVILDLFDDTRAVGVIRTR